MFDIDMRTDTREHLMEDFTLYNEWAACGAWPSAGISTFLSSGKIWSASTATWVMMYDQIQCKGMQA